LLEFAVLGAQSLVGGGEVADLGGQALIGGGDAVDSGPLAFELGVEVGVFVGEYPAFDAGFGGELQDGEGAGGPSGPSVEQSLHGGGDGVSFGVAVRAHARPGTPGPGTRPP
jgi:hypothetical protein